MNAYELADELDNMLKGAGLKNNRVPTMLRQQADRIAELEKDAEPVAWQFEILGAYGWDWVIHQKLPTDYEYRNAIPLYTTPQTKPLSDEEIIAYINKKFELELCDNHATVLAFARAIEERILGK